MTADVPPAPSPRRPAPVVPLLVNGAFRGQRITGQQRYATEIADRLARLPGVRERAVPAALARHPLGAWSGALAQGLVRRRGERLLTLTSRGPVVARHHVVVVHDLFVLEHPEWFSRAYVATHAPVLAAQLAGAEAVVTVSAPVAASVARRVRKGVPVVVAPNAPAELFRPGLPDPRALAAHGLSRRGFVLAVASSDPRKNLARLARAHAALPADVRAAHPLVLAGGSSGVFAAEPALGEGVVRLGYVDDEELARLYAAASLVAFPSLDEGFGLPAVEAFAAGTDVLAADIAVLRWVCGTEATYADPRSTDALTAGLAAALASPSGEDARAARARSVRERFSWDASARTVHETVQALGRRS